MDKSVIDNLRAMATQIRDEKGISANTATRIGRMLLAIIDALEAIPATLEYRVRDHGVWDETKVYVHGWDEETGTYVTDQVWYGGCCWQCFVHSTTAGLAPRFNNSDWVCVMGRGNVTLEIVNEKSDWIQMGARYSTTLHAVLRNAEMELTEEEISRANIVWTRESQDSAGDAAWNTLHPRGLMGLDLSIDTNEDFPNDWWKQERIGFKCLIVLPSGLEVSAQYEF